MYYAPICKIIILFSQKIVFGVILIIIINERINDIVIINATYLVNDIF